MNKKYVQALYGVGLIGVMVGATIIATNPTQHKSATIEKVQTNIEIDSGEMTFGQGNVKEDEDSPIEIGTFSFLTNSYETAQETNNPDNAVITVEKIADPSQRYRDVDEYLYVNTNINIYKEDNDKAEVLKEAEYGDYIHKIGNDPYNNDGFSKIEVDGQEGYILTQSLTNKMLFKDVSKTVYAKEDINIYEDKELTTRIGNATYIQSLQASGESNSVVRVIFGDKEAYVDKEKVSDEMLFRDDNSTVWALEALRLRVTPQTEADTQANVRKYDQITRVGISEEWSKIQLSDGSVGYTRTENLTTERPISKGEEIALYAQQFVGNRYVWGGTSLVTGADCSGFTQAIYAHFGYSINRTASAQMANGYAVSYSEARPGDLIFYSGHVAMYIGNGQIVHSSNSAPYPQGGVKISPATYTTIIGVRRIVD